ncbi:DegV family protein with EDD domain [Bacillus mesophilus]|uniref:DegV family protein n=1 Tax=Bacillus mesophilus TaxID=1808955 RepID=A0A6M0QB76_9BACI|nr:DegV family protein [Bacillus mesophilus]MBM7661599.1 DegV family protein with EDD domain [Bacillus mesophilus]NEY72268.1 DegV family protein [Bacillus mesophilus]
MKTAVVTDSTSYIPKELREKWNIHMLPLNVVFGNESYQEEAEITTEDFYEKVSHGGELPKTSQPAIGLCVNLYSELSHEYDAVISIHLSSGISGTYQGAVAAGNMVDAIKVYPYDSEISAMPQGFYVLEAAKLAQAGKGPEEIIARLDEMKKSLKAYFMVDDLSHLQRGGRLSSAQAFVGSLLQVKPVLHFVDKKIVPFEKIRTRKKAIKRMFELFNDDAKDGQPIVATIIHANRLEEATELKAELEANYPNVEIIISHFGPVIGTHLGEGAIGLGWYIK